MEELNKNQLVLLNILVSFVVSIATAVLTVGLMQETPPQITQTINRVVEKTIEKVVPVEQKPIIKEVPVIVTEQDLISKVIDNASAGLVSVWEVASGTRREISSGFLVASGTVVSYLPQLEKKSVLQVEGLDGSFFEVALVATFEDGTAALKLGKQLPKPQEKATLLSRVKKEVVGEVKDIPLMATSTLRALPLGNSKPAVGQTVVGMGITEGNKVVSVGVVSRLGTHASSTLATLRTNAATDDNIGGPLLDIKGTVVGLSRGAGEALGLPDLAAILDKVK